MMNILEVVALGVLLLNSVYLVSWNLQMIWHHRHSIVANRRGHGDWLLAVVWLMIGTMTATMAAATDSEFEKGRQKLTSVLWQQMPIGRGLNSLAASQEMAILLDRRVDPNRRCTCDLTDVPLEEALREIARSQQLGVGSIGSTFVVGPPRTTVLLATAAELANDRHTSFPEPLRSRLTKRNAWSWKRLSTPAQLVSQLADEAGLTISNPQVIPHDLWDARSLPPLTWAERMLIVLAGFDMYFEVDPQRGTITITNLPDQLSLRRTYYVRNGDANEIARRLSEQFPRAFLQVNGNSISVRSLAEDHRMIEQSLNGAAEPPVRPNPPKTDDPSLRRYTLTVQDEPVGPLLQVLARRTGLALTIDDAARAIMGQRVSFSVKEVTVEELFRRAVESVGLTAMVQHGEVTITASKSR